jgi:thiol-disulfide isomerase/thioredoxin
MFRSRLAALAGVVALLGAHRPPPTVFDLSDSIGRHAPAMTLLEPDGSPLAIDGARGTPTYVFLFASWCGPCRLAMPFVRDDYARFGDRVTFIGVDVLDDDAAARTAIASFALPFPVTIYPVEQLDAQISPDAQLRAGWKYKVPADFLIDADGVVRFSWHGLAVTTDGTPVDVLPAYLARLGIK